MKIKMLFHSLLLFLSFQAWGFCDYQLLFNEEMGKIVRQDVDEALLAAAKNSEGPLIVRDIDNSSMASLYGGGSPKPIWMKLKSADPERFPELTGYLTSNPKLSKNASDAAEEIAALRGHPEVIEIQFARGKKKAWSVSENGREKIVFSETAPSGASPVNVFANKATGRPYVADMDVISYGVRNGADNNIYRLYDKNGRLVTQTSDYATFQRLNQNNQYVAEYTSVSAENTRRALNEKMRSLGIENSPFQHGAASHADIPSSKQLIYTGGLPSPTNRIKIYTADGKVELSSVEELRPLIKKYGEDYFPRAWVDALK